MTDENNSEINNSQEEQTDNLTTAGSKSLRRSAEDKIFLGLCGGIADYFSIDSVYVRVIFILSILIGGWGIAVYLIAGMLIPLPVNSILFDSKKNPDLEKTNMKMLLGGLMVFVGMFFTFDFYGLVRFFSFMGMPVDFFWSLVCIYAGVYIYYKTFRIENQSEVHVIFSRSPVNRRVAGVCGGLSEYLKVDTNFVRMVWMIFSFITFGLGVIIYLMFWIYTPNGILIDE